MSLRYFRERETGDYLMVEDRFRFDATLDARATTFAGYPDSVQTVLVWREYLTDECQEVTRRDLPPKWAAVFHPPFPE